MERLKGEIKLGQQQLDTIRSRGNELAKKATEMQTKLTSEKQEIEVNALWSEVALTLTE